MLPEPPGTPSKTKKLRASHTAQTSRVSRYTTQRRCSFLWAVILVAALSVSILARDSISTLHAHLAPSSRCPNPHARARSPESVPAPLVRRHCHKLNISEQSSHSIEVCPLPHSASQTCNSFAVVIARRERGYCTALAAVNDASRMSRTPGEGTYVKETLGPDNFHVTIEGAQKLVLVWPSAYDESSCEWRYDVILNNGGSFNISIDLFYEEYQGFRELWEDEWGRYIGSKSVNSTGRIATWPRLIDKPLHHGPIPSSLFSPPVACTDLCPAYSLAQDLTVTPEPPTLRSHLPLCTHDSPVASIYLPHALPYQHISRPGISVANYRGIPLGCRWSQDDVGLLDASLSVEARRACLSKEPRELLFLGDSHARMLYDTLLPRLRGASGFTQLAKATIKGERIGATDFVFHWDALLERLLSPFPVVTEGGLEVQVHTTPILVLSFGAHPISAAHSSASLLGWLDRLSEPLKARRLKGLKTIFLSTPAYPPRKDNYVWDVRDWRTNFRVSNLSMLSIERLRSTGTAIIDGFGSTLPFFRDPPDRAHFVSVAHLMSLPETVTHDRSRDTPAIEFWLQELLHKVALCES